MFISWHMYPIQFKTCINTNHDDCSFSWEKSTQNKNKTSTSNISKLYINMTKKKQ